MSGRVDLHPTEPFTTLELQNPSLGVFELPVHKIRQSPDLDALKL